MFLFCICCELHLPIYPNRTLASVAIMTMTSTVTTSSAVKELANNEHTTKWILLELSLLFLYKPATYTLTCPELSNHCSISAPTP